MPKPSEIWTDNEGRVVWSYKAGHDRAADVYTVDAGGDVVRVFDWQTLLFQDYHAKKWSWNWDAACVAASRIADLESRRRARQRRAQGGGSVPLSVDKALSLNASFEREKTPTELLLESL